MRYVVHIPAPDHKSGGVRALHVLRDELVLRGLEAVMSYETTIDKAHDFVVYHEVSLGNPAGARRYAYWLLNRPSYVPVGTRFTWRPEISDDPLLNVNIVEPYLWWPGGPRKGPVGVYVGKGRYDPTKAPSDAVEITRNTHHTREELADFVRTLDHLISFDPFSNLNLEAICAGVPVRVHTDGVWDQVQIERTGWAPYGIAWRDDEMDYARATVGMARSHYFGSIVPTFERHLDRFVRLTDA